MQKDIKAAAENIAALRKLLLAVCSSHSSVIKGRETVILCQHTQASVGRTQQKLHFCSAIANVSLFTLVLIITATAAVSG